MSREVRRVPPTWQHPRGPNDEYVPLLDKLVEHTAQWDAEAALYERHEYPGATAANYAMSTFVQYYGPRPDPADYMPVWSAEERTHYQMYETCSEGTPISPVMATPEELAEWLYANKASAFGSLTATYDQWLATIRAGSTPGSMVVVDDVPMSSVEYLGKKVPG